MCFWRVEEDVRKETSLHMKAMARNNITEWLSGVCVCVRVFLECGGGHQEGNKPTHEGDVDFRI